MHCTKVLLEVCFSKTSQVSCLIGRLQGMDFLHENRVFHADILDQNIGMNVALHLPYAVKQPLGLRDGALSARYAFYDFEASVIYPLETPLEDVWETEFVGFELRGIPIPDGPFKVFPLDVLCLGKLLENRTRVCTDSSSGL
jgi:hypothetical protein